MNIKYYMPDDPVWYHYSQMSPGEQKVYMQLYDGIVEFSPKVAITGISFPKNKEADIIFDILDRMEDDIPEFFFLGRSTVWTGSEVSVELRYLFSPAETVRILKKIRRKTFLLLNTLPLGQVGKIQKIHDYLVTHCTYGNPNRDAAHRIDGAFLEGTPVCEGFARAAQYLCIRAGIPCTKVGGNIRKAIHGSTGHSWNIVWIRKKPYHMDVTFDAAQSGSEQPIRYDYFLLSDNEIYADRLPTRKYPIPACPHAYCYYEKNKAYYDHEDQLFRAVVSAARENATIVFQLPGRRAGRPLDHHTVSEMIRTAIRRENMDAAYTLEYNDNRRVYCVRFKKIKNNKNNA